MQIDLSRGVLGGDRDLGQPSVSLDDSSDAWNSKRRSNSAMAADPCDYLSREYDSTGS